MSVYDVIRSRRSVRTFDGKPLKDEDEEKIMDFAAEAENPFGLPITWLMLDAKERSLSSPVIVGEDKYIAGKMRRVPYAEEAFGFSFEKIVLFAESIGIGTTWIAGTMDRSSFEAAAGLKGGEVMPCVSPLGYPAKKMSIRESVMRKGVKAESRFPFDEIFFDSSFEKPLSAEKAGKLKDVLEAVRLAPSAVNKQPWRVVISGEKAHFFEKRSKAKKEGEWDIQKIDIGIALCHFELAARESGMSVEFMIDDPGLDRPEDVFYIASFGFKSGSDS